MIIPLPCKFGDVYEYKGKRVLFIGVSWFKWSSGMEYTYFFKANNKWRSSIFYQSSGQVETEKFEIDDKLTQTFILKTYGYPLKGTGKIVGLDYINNHLYVDILSDTFFYAHFKAKCGKYGHYIKGSNIIFPPSWDTNDKKEKALLKRML